MDHSFIPGYTPPPLTPELQAVKDAAEELLRARGVWDIDSYGWLDMEEPDPDFIGYVMWIQSPPYDHDIMNWQYNIPPRRAPTDQEESLVALGHDFFGFMKTSRHFIGHTLLYEPHMRPMDIDSAEFDFSEFAALSALVSTLDRVRDFVITAVLGRKTQTKGELETSFVQIEQAGFAPLATQLRAGFAAARKVRKARNDAVHGISTVPARVHREIVERDRKAFIEQSWGRSDDLTAYAEQIKAWDREVEAELESIRSRTTLLCETYISLIKTGEVSIQAEYNMRKRRGAPTS
jgi:hypothetical protein